jgi:hypothetical protein
VLWVPFEGGGAWVCCRNIILSLWDVICISIKSARVRLGLGRDDVQPCRVRVVCGVLSYYLLRTRDHGGLQFCTCVR